MITIEPMSEQYTPAVLNLTLAEDQKAFVGETSDVLSNLQDGVYPFVVLAGATVVGFFMIDTQYDSRYDFADSASIGLRNYFIGEVFQGKGYAKQTLQALPNVLREQFSSFSSVYLTVNCRNPIAKSCYLKGGFVDTETLYLGGSHGPQHIMRFDLTL